MDDIYESEISLDVMYQNGTKTDEINEERKGIYYQQNRPLDREIQPDQTVTYICTQQFRNISECDELKEEIITRNKFSQQNPSDSRSLAPKEEISYNIAFAKPGEFVLNERKLISTGEGKSGVTKKRYFYQQSEPRSRLLSAQEEIMLHLPLAQPLSLEIGPVLDEPFARRRPDQKELINCNIPRVPCILIENMAVEYIGHFELTSPKDNQLEEYRPVILLSSKKNGTTFDKLANIAPSKPSEKNSKPVSKLAKLAKLYRCCAKVGMG
ncbi:Hypothetical predicted protein [Octopus vulgaris]|uniref:Uncharacterized protein n=1 Tax=Octopus vulgaris TaxID=6645 RepID=A0AA36FJ78_OCTVU|nr:Hypothetical predicted protein [Octopus vulgaris]